MVCNREDNQEVFVNVPVDDDDHHQDTIITNEASMSTNNVPTTSSPSPSTSASTSNSTPTASICEQDPEYPEDPDDDLDLDLKTPMKSENPNDITIDATITSAVTNTVKSTLKSRLTVCGHPVTRIVWFNVFMLLTVHALALWGYFHAIFFGIKWQTILFAFHLGAFSGLGMSVGAHRLWAHRSFKARWPLKLLLTIFQTMSMNGSIFSYARDHRTHHKYSDSIADPKSSARGFFFAHVGWWLVRKNKEVLTNGKKVKIDDLLDDPFVYYQNKFYTPLVILWWGIIPTVVPYYCWGEDLLLGHLICVHLRYIIFLHHFFTVNSIAHFWGYRPYDFHIPPTENRLVAYLSLGEGAHNYHHTFPYDYRSGQQGWLYGWDPSTLFIDVAAWLGFAYDRKKASRELIAARINRTGLPENFDDWDWKKKKVKALFCGLIDWIVGFFVSTWVLWLGGTIKLFYIAILCAIRCREEHGMLVKQE